MKPFFAHATVIDTFFVLELDEEMGSRILGIQFGQETVGVFQDSFPRQLQLEYENSGAIVEYLVLELFVLERQVDEMFTFENAGDVLGRLFD